MYLLKSYMHCCNVHIPIYVLTAPCVIKRKIQNVGNSIWHIPRFPRNNNILVRQIRIMTKNLISFAKMTSKPKISFKQTYQMFEEF